MKQADKLSHGKQTFEVIEDCGNGLFKAKRTNNSKSLTSPNIYVREIESGKVRQSNRAGAVWGVVKKDFINKTKSICLNINPTTSI